MTDDSLTLTDWLTLSLTGLLVGWLRDRQPDTVCSDICYLLRRILYAQTQGSQTRIYDFLRERTQKMRESCAFVIQSCNISLLWADWLNELLIYKWVIDKLLNLILDAEKLAYSFMRMLKTCWEISWAKNMNKKSTSWSMFIWLPTIVSLSL